MPSTATDHSGERAMTTSIGQRLLDAEMRLLGFRSRAEARPLNAYGFLVGSVGKHQRRRFGVLTAKKAVVGCSAAGA